VPRFITTDTIAYLPGDRWPINIIPLCMAASQIWLMAMTPRPATLPAARDDVHAADLSVYLLQFCRGSGIILHNQNLFSIVQFYTINVNRCRRWKSACPPENENG